MAKAAALANLEARVIALEQQLAGQVAGRQADAEGYEAQITKLKAEQQAFQNENDARFKELDEEIGPLRMLQEETQRELTAVKLKAHELKEKKDRLAEENRGLLAKLNALRVQWTQMGQNFG